MSNMALESEDHAVTDEEREFWKALSVVMQHLHTRALNAEEEVYRLRKELDVKRDQIEYLTTIQTESR
jgi:hypothetical protein